MSIPGSFKFVARPVMGNLKPLPAVVCLLMLLLPICLAAQSGSTDHPRKVVVVAGKQYENPPGGLKVLLGDNYRDLWTTPIEIEVLDLQNFADGLKPVMRIGGLQTLGLALKGQDGRDYSFRSVNKVYAPEVIPPAFRDTIIEDIIQDQISANFPGVQVIAPPIEKAAGVPAIDDARLVVMPDDPALGEFQKTFAGVLGIIMEYPEPVSATNPGFHGATEILGHEEFWKERQAGIQNLPDTRVLLRARLLDIFFNDWDRHHQQWRWARFPGNPLLQAIPEDRDQVFTNFEGMMLDFARTEGAQFVRFEKEFEPLYRVTKNGWDVDRFLLTNLEKPEWMEIAKDVQSRLTDDVIYEGLHRMPAEYYKLRGEEMATKLKNRRDKMTDMAERYYRYLADKVDVQCTNQSEIVTIQGFDNGDLEVSVAVLQPSQADNAPYYRRRFVKGETHDVRIYLHGGNNQVVTKGKKRSGITVRVIGGPGDDTVDDSQGFGVKFYDFEGNNSRIGENGTGLKKKPYTMPVPDPPNNTPWVPAQDWGALKKPLFVAGYHPDPGFSLGAGFDITKHAFRKYPYSSHQTIQGGFAFGAKKPFVDYKGAFRLESSRLDYILEARVSGIDQLRFYGIGNDTTNDLNDSQFRISNYQYTLFPGLSFSGSEKASLAFGPILKYSDSSGTDPDTVLGREQPLGSGKFGEFGLHARGRYDSRGVQTILNPGFVAQAEGSYFFKTWDVEKSFGSVYGYAGGIFRLSEPLLVSIYAGGKKVWGDYPFFEAAYIGGNLVPLGTKWNRWAGDASLGGLTILQWTVKKLKGRIPGDFGFFALADSARVFVQGEDSSSWHPSYSGGIFVAPFRRSGSFRLGFGSSPDQGFFFTLTMNVVGLSFQ